MSADFLKFPDAVADYLGVSVDWVKKNRKGLPGLRRLSRKVWVFHKDTFIDSKFPRRKI